MSEDLQPRTLTGPPRYASRTDKPVEVLTLADHLGSVIGYLFANDEDSAAGWCPHPSASPAAQNLAGLWLLLLHGACERGLKPCTALDELQSVSRPDSHILPNSRRTVASIAAIVPPGSAHSA